MNYLDELLDYLLKDTCADTCGKCVNFRPWTEEEEDRLGDNLQTCKAVKNRLESPPRNVCREGMKAWYKANAER